MKPMRLLAFALLSIVLLTCESPEATPYYGCAPRAGLRLIEYWQAEGVETPLLTEEPQEVERQLAWAMGTSRSGHTSMFKIAPAIHYVCPSLTARTYICDTAMWKLLREPLILLDHDVDHVEFYLLRPPWRNGATWSAVIAEPNWVCEDCGVSFAPTIQTMTDEHGACPSCGSCAISRR
jgi:DNA-directed RNA polymerase subunit RPC12/RpoP